MRADFRNAGKSKILTGNDFSVYYAEITNEN